MAEETNNRIPEIYLSERLNIFEPIDPDYYSNGGLPPDSGIELIQWINKGIEQGVIHVGEAWETNLSYDIPTGTVLNDNGDGFVIPLATLYRRGLISQQDYAKLNHITVTRNINLDDLLETQLPIIINDSPSIKKEEIVSEDNRIVKFTLSNIETATLGQVPVKGYNDEILWVSLNVEPNIEQTEKTSISFRLKVSENSSIIIEEATEEFAGLLGSEDKIKLNGATSANTVETIVQRDENGGFEAESIVLNTGIINETATQPKDIVNLETVEDKIQIAVEAFTSDKYYEHYQSIASTTWIVNHMFGRYPSVSVKDTSGRIIYGGIEHFNVNTAILTWSVPVSGTGIFT